MKAEHVLLLALAGCGATQSDPSLDALREADDLSEREVALDGTLSRYVEHGVSTHPALRAQLERWRAANRRVGASRRWPRPTIGYTAYVRPVETRVGPQRQRVSVRVPLAWPSQLRSAPEAAGHASSAQAHRFAARVLALQARVADVYWTRWLIARRTSVLSEQGIVLEGLAEVVRGRIAVGGATLAELQSIELRRARLAEGIDALAEAGLRAETMLREAIGLDADAEVPLSQQPPQLVDVAETPDVLRSAARERPELEEHHAMARAADAEAAGARAARLPNIVLGLDWIETAEARMPNVAGSGDDALMLGVMVGVPIDAGRERRRAEAAEAEARAHQLDAEARALEIHREVDVALSEVRDALRRSRLYEATLAPQAASAYEALLGAYAAGRATVALLLQAQRELLEIELEREQSAADYARAWAQLEHAVGRPVRGAER